MKKSILITGMFCISISFMSCKKDSSKPISSGDIQGTWLFQSMDVQTSASIEETLSGVTTKTVTTTDYTTGDNSGTMKFDGSTLTSNNVTYSINTVLHESIYTDGNLLSSTDVPFNMPAMSSSGSSGYTLIGADSIHFEGGSVLSDAYSGDTNPSGAKLSLQGDLLTMTQTVNQTKTDDIGGIPVTTIESLKAVIRLKRQ